MLKRKHYYLRKEKQVAWVGRGCLEPHRIAISGIQGWLQDCRGLLGWTWVCVHWGRGTVAGAQGPQKWSWLGPGLGSCNPGPLLPALRTSLTSSTFSSSKVGSSTIPGMTAAAPTLTRCPLPRCPGLLELPFPTPMQPTQRLRVRSQRHACALLCPTATDGACATRKCGAPGGVASRWLRPPPGCHSEAVSTETGIPTAGK
jgi:hypothetical protein